MVDDLQGFIPLVEECHASGRPYRKLWEEAVAGSIPCRRVNGRWYVRSTAKPDEIEVSTAESPR